MTGQIQAGTLIGIAPEAVYGTYVAPTRFFALKSESLSENWAHVQRRLLRGIADSMGMVAGFHHVEGDLSMELYHTLLPHFLYASRNEVTKSGAGPYVYTTTPVHVGDVRDLPPDNYSLSITLVKGGEVFAFTGCTVSQMQFTQEEGIPTMTISIIGSAEAEESAPSPTFPATDVPFNAGQYTIQVPIASTITSVENFTFTVNDNAEPQFRLSNNSGATWVKFGEREVSAELTVDFESRAEWDAFKAITATSVSIKMTSGAHSVELRLPQAVRETYEIDGASDQGSPVMANCNYQGTYDPVTSKSYEIIVTTSEDIS